MPPDITGTITPSDAPVAVTTTTPGQNAKLTFSGSAGQRISLKWTNNTYACCNDLSIINPDSTVLVSTTCTECSSFFDTRTLPATGTYTIFLNPDGSNTGSMAFTLYDVPPDITGTITPGGPSVTVTTTVPGQNAKLTFSGTAGQRVSLKWSNDTYACCNDLWIINPDSTVLVSTGCTECSSFFDTKVLPQSGTYTILLSPAGANTGSMAFTLYDVPPDITGTITIGGPSVTVTTTTPGQNARLTFSGTAGQLVNLGISSATIPGCDGDTFVLKPDGTTLTSNTCPQGGAELDMVLPATGTYTILVDPNGSSTGSMTLTLSTPITGTIAINGASVTVSITRPGQDARITFSGTAGQSVTLRMTSVTFSGCNANVYILKPDTTTLGSDTCVSSGDSIGAVLPVSGTYTILLDPDGSSTGGMTLTLTSP